MDAAVGQDLLDLLQGMHYPAKAPAPLANGRDKPQVFRIARKDDILPGLGIVEGPLGVENARMYNKHKKKRPERAIVLMLRRDGRHVRACDNQCLRRR